jgi:TonB dependent receptor
LGGIPGLAAPEPITYGIPSVGITGYTTFGDSSTAPDFSHNHTFQVIDNVTIVRGKHTMVFGVEIRRDQYNQEGNQFVDMSLGFINGYATANPAPGQSSSTGNAFADFILGVPNNSAGPVLPLAVAQLRATDQYYYAQDAWKIRPNLTIDAGLRYELEPPYWAKHDELMNTQINSIPQTEAALAGWCPSSPCVAPGGSVLPVIVREGTGNNFYAGLPWVFGAGIPVAQDGRMGQRLVQEDYTMIAPRVGLAYSPSAKWSIRSGFGRFYAMDVGNAVYDMSRNLAVRRNVTGAFPHPNLTLENPFGLANGSSGLTVTGPTILSNWAARRSPYEFVYELVAQRQFTSTAALEVGYVGSQGHHLDRFRNLNVPPPEAGTPQLNRPDPLLGLIQEVQDYVNSSYNSMELKYTQQLSHGMNALIGYTYSRSIDNGSAIRSHGGDADFPQNDYCQGSSIACGEIGPSNFNQTHRLVSSLLYEPPIGRGHAFLNHGIAGELLGNWQFNEIFSIASGLPFTFSYSANILNGGGGNSSGSGGRPNYTGATLAPTGGKDWRHWFNTAGYQNPPLYQFGNVSRNSMYGPGVIQWDSSLLKNFPVHNEQQLQFRFEAFNAANHPNFGLPGAVFGSSTFSQISTLAQASSNRELQLSLKYVF